MRFIEAKQRHQSIKQILAVCLHQTSKSNMINLKKLKKFSSLMIHSNRNIKNPSNLTNVTNITNFTKRIDNIVLNPMLAIPCFLLFMYLIFTFTIQLSGTFKNEWEGILQFLCIDKLAEGLEYLDSPVWLIELIAQGLGQGIMTTLCFIPVIGCMFFCLTLLETSGYMARVSFMMDKIMQWVGLSGQAFVPMILGFGCNVPAILATRTLSNRRERILTIIMSPFMSCGARLAIYALFVNVFFKSGGQNIIFFLYLIGILVALLTGLALRGVFFSREKTPLIMSLPPYRWPNLGNVWRITWHQIQKFVYKAGMIIVPLSIILSSLTAFRTSDQESWLAHISKSITPIFAPIGIEQDNWQATAGLISGIMAKEVVVGTLNSLYSQEAREKEIRGIIKKEKDAIKIGETIKAEGEIKAVGTVKANESINSQVQSSQSLYLNSQEMAVHFRNYASVFAYLLFVLLYFPCVSVLAAIARELTPPWAIFTVVWTTGLAYIISVLFYQSAMIFDYPYRSLSGIFSMLFLLLFGLKGMKKWIIFNLNKEERRRMPVPTQLLIIN